MRRVAAGAGRAPRAVGPARDRRVSRSLPLPRLLRLRLWRGNSSFPEAARSAPPVFPCAVNAATPLPSKIAADRLAGRARPRSHRPLGPRRGGLAGGAGVAGADRAAGKTARRDHDCRGGEAAPRQRRFAHRPRRARPRGAQGRHARRLSHGGAGIRLRGRGTRGICPLGPLALRFLDRRTRRRKSSPGSPGAPAGRGRAAGFCCRSTAIRWRGPIRTAHRSTGSAPAPTRQIGAHRRQSYRLQEGHDPALALTIGNGAQR